jgi:Fe2+ or Zn2+ uptake regulation protein
MSLEIPGIHPQIFQKLMAAFAHAKKQLDDTGFTSFGKDEYKCDKCGTKTFLVATDHRIEAAILLHLVCADCGATKDIMCKVIPNLSLLEEKPGEEEGKKQSSKNPPA